MKRNDFLVSPLKTNGLVIYIHINNKIYNKNGFKSEENWFIGNTKITNNAPIISRVNEMHRECFGNDITLEKNNTLVLYIQPENDLLKEGYLKLYNKNIEEAFKFLNLEINKKNILACFRIEPYAKYAEIWDVCTDPRWRGRGIMHSLFEDFNRSAPNYFRAFWLAVLYENSSRDKSINLYARSGFKFDRVTFQTPSGKTFPYPVISLVNLRDNIQVNPFEIKRLSYKGLDNIKCDFNIVLNWKNMIEIQQKYFNKNKEYGGKFDIIADKNKKNEYLLIPNFLNAVQGGESFQVSPPSYYFNWHTHPNLCNIKLGCYIVWPSSWDMRYIYINYSSGLLFHTVFTPEGLYTIKLTTELMKFIYIISKNSEWITNIADLIFFRFSYLENYRKVETDIERSQCIKKYNSPECLFYPNKNRNEKIVNFIKFANNANFYQYASTKAEEIYFNILGVSTKESNEKSIQAIKYFEEIAGRVANFPLFEVGFYSSEYIIQNQNTVQKIFLKTIKSPLNQFCPY
jgi:GNAT superfamily N-acetyltransferase